MVCVGDDRREVGRVNDIVNAVGEFPFLNLFQHRPNDLLLEVIHRRDFTIGDIVQIDHVSGRDHPSVDVVVGDEFGGRRICVDDQDQIFRPTPCPADVNQQNR